MSAWKRCGVAKASSPPARVWWSTWLAVVCWALLVLVAVVPAVLGFAVTAFYTVDTVSGTDLSVEQGQAPAWLRGLCAVGLVGALVLPVVVARWARKQWLGWFLVGWMVTGVVLIVGLAMFDIV